ncbi:Rap1a/Tai family immunity protein [Mesorhizobium sp.]|uniref:Rap1a/Tai family immunity protein n=1 Tax=Mesorhizobium sp. TaxID=1871066 RepID=UPI00344BD396
MVLHGYVGGIADQMVANGMFAAREEFSICVGKKVPTHGAYKQAFINWADDHPESWQNHQYLGVVEALRSTWPSTSL